MDLYWCISTIIFSEDNTIFALTFMGGKINNSVNNGKGISLNGENYHRIGSRFVQLKVFNTENEVKNMINYVSCDEEMVTLISNLFSQTQILNKNCPLSSN